MQDEELYLVIGGATTSWSSFINAITKMVSTIFDIGRTIGSAINYKLKKTKC